MSIRAKRHLWLIGALVSGVGIAWQAGRATVGEMNIPLFIAACTIFFICAPTAMYFRYRTNDWKNKAASAIKQAQDEVAKEKTYDK